MTQAICRVLVTGANGFIGKNLVVRLSELTKFAVIKFVRGDAWESLPSLLAQADAVVHLAGENRPAYEAAFTQANTDLTMTICQALAAEQQRSGRQLPLVFASSAQADQDNPYGRS